MNKLLEPEGVPAQVSPVEVESKAITTPSDDKEGHPTEEAPLYISPNPKPSKRKRRAKVATA